MNGQSITTSTCRIWLDQGILRAELLPGAGQSLVEAHENVAAYELLLAGKRLPLVVDLRPFSKALDREVRQYYTGPTMVPLTPAIALLIGPPVSHVVGSFILGVAAQSVPWRLFTEEADALEWLRGYAE